MLNFFHKNKKGFTLIELLVVVSIFALLTTITVWNYGKFNSNLSIQNLADDIALTVRRAQGFAIGVRGYEETFSGGYGIHFTADPTTAEYAGSNKSFVLFADMGGKNWKYDYDGNSNTCGNPSSGNECIEVLSIKSADGIKAVSYTTGNSVNQLSESGTADILFYRPNPEPVFCVRNTPDNNECDTVGPISSIIIEISNIGTSDTVKTITISNNGQISVSN